MEYSDRGQVATVEWSREQLAVIPPWMRFRPEREFDRIVRQNNLLPGQAELREQVRIERLTAASLRMRNYIGRFLTGVTYGRLGSYDPLYRVTVQSGTGTLPAGTPLWSAPGSKVAVMPAAVTTDHSVFEGVTTAHNEPAAKPLKAQKTGDGLARVLGPISSGQSLTQAPGANYLIEKSTAEETAPVIATAEEDHDEATVALVRVIFGGGAGGGEGESEAVWA